jgi:hypothetical protein
MEAPIGQLLLLTLPDSTDDPRTRDQAAARSSVPRTRLKATSRFLVCWALPIHLIKLAIFLCLFHGLLNGCLSIGSGRSFSNRRIVHSNAWIGLKSSREPNFAVSDSERNEDISVVNQENRQITPMTIRL